MNHKIPRIGAGLAIALAAVSLAGCGGSDDNGNGNGNNPTPTPPPSAAVDPSLALVKQLVAQGGSDSAEPVVLSDAAFPGNDTAEPDAI